MFINNVYIFFSGTNTGREQRLLEITPHLGSYRNLQKMDHMHNIKIVGVMVTVRRQKSAEHDDMCKNVIIKTIIIYN